MKTEIEKQIAGYTTKLNNLKENRSKEFDHLTDEENRSYDTQIQQTAEFIHVLKGLKMELEQNVINLLPSDVQDLIERKATRRLSVTELNAVVFRLEDVKEIISVILGLKKNN